MSKEISCVYGVCIADVARITARKNNLASIVGGINFAQSSIHRATEPEKKAALEQSLANLQDKLVQAEDALTEACSGLCSMCPYRRVK